REFPVMELRLDEDGGQTQKLRGYAAVFNKLSENLGGFREKIAPGAFTKTLKTADVRLLLNHEGLPLARTKSGTLTLSEDENGLRFESDLEAADPDVQRIVPKLRRNDLNQTSFGFFTVLDKWEHPAEGNNKESSRTLIEVDLYDISLVTFPAYPQTSVNIRSAKEVYDSYLASLRAQDEAIKIERQRALAAHRERQIKIWRYML
ncbi:MAG TPA: HK97 family phage prohead protease, partial [Dissulfurispiraceae bacterium]|nr:HK97 family phage prohead protease [Dissulfurispiraceae bacterium]